MTMKIERKKITVRDLTNGYRDDGEGGVRGYGGKLDIRPPFQREFVYKDKQRDEVIRTLNRGFPLNVMYWATREDGTYEVIDGQQRTISAAQYVHNIFSLDGMYFNNLQDDEQAQILAYELQVYLCDGTPSEKLAWFRIINIAGEELTDQELRNAVYAGSWVHEAKRYFSRPTSPAYAVGKKYVKGSPIRQKYLETAIEWIIERDGSNQTIEEYMGLHQHDKTAIALWNHFQAVINQVQAVFPTYRSAMKGVDWGGLYQHLEDENLDPKVLEDQVANLIQDGEVQRKAGIYSYLLTGKKKHLNLRTFDLGQKQKAFERQNGECRMCGKKYTDLSEMHADHITPWTKGGKTNDENCQVLCRDCNLEKSDR